MTDDRPDTADRPRHDIAASSLRALRAARGDAAPAADAYAENDAENEVTPADAVPSIAGTDTTAETDTGATDDDATDTVATDTDATDCDATGSDATDSDATDSDATHDDATDDEPPVLASAPPRSAMRRAAADIPARTRRRPSRLTAIGSTVAAAALGFTAVSGVVWWRADHDTQRTAAVARDDVALDARLAIATVNTSDYRKPDAALRNWLTVSTGSLKSQFTDQRKAATTLLGQSKMITSATVLEAAVTKLDTAKGSATVIASVNLKRKPASGAASTTRNRFRATLTRQGDDWLLADLALVSVQLT